MSVTGANTAASVRARLLNLARCEGIDFNEMLVHFGLERMLYRLSASRHRERFLLKGALLFTLWYDVPHRATRDMDLLGVGHRDMESLAEVFREIAAEVHADGIEYDPASVSVSEIRKESGYGGVRVNLVGNLSGARCRVQIDVGFGDAITPEPEESTYPVLLGDLPAPRLRVYPMYTVVAEKFHAIALLGMTNTRLKDYFDLGLLFERERMDDALLAQAIKATFERRGMHAPMVVPVGLTAKFSQDASRQSLWAAFLRKNGLPLEPLGQVVDRLQAGLAPALRLLAV